MKQTREVIVCDACYAEVVPFSPSLNGPLPPGWIVVCRYWYSNFKQLHFCLKEDCKDMAAKILFDELNELNRLKISWHRASRIIEQADKYEI